MTKIRINELARELEVKPNVILELLPELGVTDKKTHSSSLDDDLALMIRRHLGGPNPNRRSRHRPKRLPKKPMRISRYRYVRHTPCVRPLRPDRLLRRRRQWWRAARPYPPSPFRPPSPDKFSPARASRCPRVLGTSLRRPLSPSPRSAPLQVRRARLPFPVSRCRRDRDHGRRLRQPPLYLPSHNRSAEAALCGRRQNRI